MNPNILHEPSTWAGFGLLATGISSCLAQDYSAGIPQVMTGLAAIFKREQTSR